MATNPLTYYRENEVVQNELYSTQVTEIVVGPDMFHNISGNLYPAKGLTNNIGSAAGIEFFPAVRTDTVYGDEVIQSDGLHIRKACGIKCTKQGRKMRPDGSWQTSSPCTYEFNWEDRAELDFIATPEKYSSDIAKRKHILELKKFASQRASTGAELMVIRELTGMPTAFKKAELDAAGSVMMFSQIVKSKALQEAEARAYIDNIRNGGRIASDINETASMLTGGEADVQEDFNNKFTRPGKTEPEKTEPDDSEIKKQATAMLDKLPGVNKDAYDFYSKTINDNQWSDDVCAWAVEDIGKKFPGLK